MKPWLAFVFVLALAVALGGALARVPEALAEVEAFRVREIRLRGARFLTPKKARSALALPTGASVWDDTKVLEARLREHPLVKDVTIYRRFPGTLLLRVQEREPVALVSTPTLEPVDETGRLLPIDPAFHKLDLPIVTLAGGEGAGSLSPGGLRLLAGEISRLAREYPELHAKVSDVILHPPGDVRARISDPPITLRFRPGVSNGRIQTAFRALEDARAHFDEGGVREVDLRFRDQVVVRFAEAGGR